MQVHVHVVEVLQQRLQHLLGEVGHVHGLHVLELSGEDDGQARLPLVAGVLDIGVQDDVRQVDGRGCRRDGACHVVVNI